VKYLRHTKTKISDSLPQICMWVRERCSIYGQNKSKRDQKVKLLNGFLKKHRVRWTWKLQRKRKGERVRGRNG